MTELTREEWLKLEVVELKRKILEKDRTIHVLLKKLKANGLC